MPRIIFHVDMDAFFASVEQRDHPAYRGKPLIVGAPPNQRGVVCAASYEARKFKVRSAMPSRTAARLCPQGIFVRPRMDVYRSESRLIMAILGEATAGVEKVSVDEAYLDVSERFACFPDQDAALFAAVSLAKELKQRIQQERQLTASIGIGSNKFLAKIGSDFQKPDGLTLIPERDKAVFLRPLSVRSIHGVGPVTAEALEQRGLITIGDIQDSPIHLSEIVGSWATSLKERAYGHDDRPLDLSDERKSISSETTFLNDTDDRTTLRLALRELAEDVSKTLHENEVSALTIQIKVRYSDFTTLTRQIRLEEPLSEERDIYRMACFLLSKNKLVQRPLRLLGIGASTLVAPTSEQQMRLAF
jgi:DNA polymerase IV